MNLMRWNLWRKQMRNKYRAKKTTIDGITFDSRKEAMRYQELKLLEKAKVIKDLKLQPKFELQESFRREGETYRAITYIADFMYIDCATGKTVVEDVKSKGTVTQVYQIKKKMFLKLYGDKYDFFENVE